MLTKTSMCVILQNWSSFHIFHKNSSSSSGWDLLLVSLDVDLCGVFKRCQKKRIIKDYYLKLYLKSRGGNQARPIAIAFRSWLLWYFRRSMLPLQLWIHLSKSLEISHEEDRDKRESTQSVRAWRCRALMWVFISIQIDPVIIFSQDFLLQLLLWLVSGHRHLLRLQMVSKEAYYTKEKSCTTWQDMFRHRLPQNRCSIMHNFAVFWRKFAHRCDLIYENDGTPKDSRAV